MWIIYFLFYLCFYKQAILLYNPKRKNSIMTQTTTMTPSFAPATSSSFHFVREAHPVRDGKKGVVFQYNGKAMIFKNADAAESWFAAEQKRLRTQQVH
jgi:hypothetical protein